MKRNYLTGSLIIAVIVLSILLFRTCDKKHDVPTKLITVAAAKELNQNYIRLRSPLIEGNIGKMDATAFWYSIEELENYIHYIKSEGEKSNRKASGIRFYLGVYPNDSITYQEKAGLTTIFLSPTVKRNPNILRPQGFQGAKNVEEHLDNSSIQSMDLVGMGHPPKLEYPIEQ